MKKITFFFCFLFLSVCDFNADQRALWVEHVIDGDTFIADGKTYRVWGINAPEKEEPFYHTARLTLESLILEQELICNYIKIDRYERSVKRCYVGSEDIGAYMVRKGLAFDYTQFSKGYYERDEIAARNKKIGIWKE